jgi:hypothetical protein
MANTVDMIDIAKPPVYWRAAASKGADHPYDGAYRRAQRFEQRLRYQPMSSNHGKALS